MKVVIAGAGTYGQVYWSYLTDSGDFEVVGFLDDAPDLQGGVIRDVPVLGDCSAFGMAKSAGAEGLIAPIGNNKARVKILVAARSAGLEIPSFVHPTAAVASTAELGEAVYILPQTVVMPFVRLSDFVMLSVGTNVIHHAQVGAGSFLSNGVNLGANVSLGARVFVGMGATIMTGVAEVGDDAVVGAGAVVIRDVPVGSTVVGNPARAIGVSVVDSTKVPVE